QDLFFRIHVMDITLPPLRERGDDILILARHFIGHVCRDWIIPIKQLTEAAEEFLLHYPFPGNVRELRNMIERAITLSETAFIDVQHLNGSSLRDYTSAVTEATDYLKIPRVITQQPETKTKLPHEGLEQYLEKIEKEILLNALNCSHWNRTLAAKKLGMSFRSLRYRLKKFGLDTEES
ncbi:helix-turn-helix domain-containing protein, partial [uncultured Acinetobacter sp.]|uniref:helix-turn-helix domain-containing protein n=1 Tax=uncultured Acinetobacter sp. TaxID=165433 RepID=UPI00258E9D2F